MRRSRGQGILRQQRRARAREIEREGTLDAHAVRIPQHEPVRPEATRRQRLAEADAHRRDRPDAARAILGLDRNRPWARGSGDELERQHRGCIREGAFRAPFVAAGELRATPVTAPGGATSRNVPPAAPMESQG